LLEHPGRLHQVPTLTRQTLRQTAIHKKKMIMTLQAGDKLMSLYVSLGDVGHPRSTLDRWQYKGDGPVGYRVGRHVRRYRREAVEAWLEQQAD